MKICIQNLGAYNEGYLLFKWLELPATSQEIQEALDEIKVCNDSHQYYDECGNPYEEYHIADIEDFPFEYSEFADIDELNELAEKYEALDETQQEAFEAFTDNGYNANEALEKAENNEFYYIEADNKTELAEKYINQVYGDVTNLDPDTLARYFDFEAFGRDLSYNFTATSNGYIDMNY